jgi:hypothetical protein
MKGNTTHVVFKIYEKISVLILNLNVHDYIFIQNFVYFNCIAIISLTLRRDNIMRLAFNN